MLDLSPRRFPVLAPWAALVIAAVGWTLPAAAQQSSPGPLAPPKQDGNAVHGSRVGHPGPVHQSAPPTRILSNRPRFSSIPRPLYPELGHLNRVEGVVGIRFAIDETGRVTEVTLAKTSGSAMLDSLVRDHTLLEWTFQPALLNGKPVAGGVTKEFEFKLDPDEQRRLAEKRLALPVGIADPPYPKEALAIRPPPKGACTVGVRWTKAGLVDLIYLAKASGSNALGPRGLAFRLRELGAPIPPTAAKDEAFTKVINFTPP